MNTTRIFIAIAILIFNRPIYAQLNPGNQPPFQSAQNSGTDVVCALHADTITGLTCNNQVTDGSTETAFRTTVTLPAGTLSSNVISMAMNFGVISPAGANAGIIKFYLGASAGMSGTLIYQSSLGIAGTSTSYNSTTLSCHITAAGAAASSTATQTACIGGINNSPAVKNVAPTSSTLTTPVAANSALILTITIQYASNTTGSATWLYSISPN